MEKLKISKSQNTILTPLVVGKNKGVIMQYQRRDADIGRRLRNLSLQNLYGSLPEK